MLETDAKKIWLAQNFAITKKSTIFGQSLWNLVKMTSSWVDKIAEISAGSNENCRFFISSEILSQFLHQYLFLALSSSSQFFLSAPWWREMYQLFIVSWCEHVLDPWKIDLEATTFSTTDEKKIGEKRSNIHLDKKTRLKLILIMELLTTQKKGSQTLLGRPI